MKSLSLVFLLLGFLMPASSPGASVSAVVWSGTPTTPGSTKEWFTGFSNATVNDAGTVAFNASVRQLVMPPWAIPLSDATFKTITSNTALNPVPAPAPVPLFTNSWNGIWTVDAKGVTKRVVRTGNDQDPFIMDAGGFGSLGAPLLNNSNLCAYSGNYSPGYIRPIPVDPGSPVTNFLSLYGGQGLWTSLNAPLSPAVFVGQTAPGYTTPFTTKVGILNAIVQYTNGIPLAKSPITFTNRPSFASLDGIALPDNGRLLFSATAGATNYYFPALPTNPGMAIPLYVAIQPLLQRGIWGQDSKGQLNRIVREGDLLSVGKTNRTVVTIAPGSSLFPMGSVNPLNGEIAVNATFDDGSQGILVGSAGSSSLSLAALTGDSAPGGNSGDFFLTFGTPSINAASHVAFCGTAGFVTPSPIVYASATLSTNLPTRPPGYTNIWSGLWAEDAAGKVKLIARIAPPVPDMGGFTSLNTPLINSKHQVAFRGIYRKGFILTPLGSFAGGEGVWTSLNPSNPVVWVGQTAPGYPTNFTISVKSPYGWSTNMIPLTSTPPVMSSIDRIVFPDTGRLVVWGTASATNWVPLPPVPKGMVVTQEIRSSVLNQRGIWIQNAQGKLDLALREGMSVAVNGSSKVISSLPLPSPTTPTSGQGTLCSCSKGIVVTTATFTDGTQAILRITP